MRKLVKIGVASLMVCSILASTSVLAVWLMVVNGTME